MAYNSFLLLRQCEDKRTCREWIYGIIYENIFAKANNDRIVCVWENL